MSEQDSHIHREDSLIREVMQETKIKVPENLRYRIMHQIETESVLTPSKINNKDTSNVLRDLALIFGTMYVVLAVMATIVYIMFGKDNLMSNQFIGMAIFVAFIFSMLWLISRIDSYIINKRSQLRNSSSK